MSKEDVLLFGTYGMRGSGKSYYEKLIEKDKEIERLKQGYCPIKEKCNKGECDCTNEEYNQMCEENTKLDLEIERLNNIIDNAIKGIEDFYYGDDEYKKYDYTLAYKIYHILKRR